MPSGRFITATISCHDGFNDCFMRINLFPLTADRTISDGLCGNYDGDEHNDLPQEEQYSQEPVDFSASFL